MSTHPGFLASTVPGQLGPDDVIQVQDLPLLACHNEEVPPRHGPPHIRCWEQTIRWSCGHSGKRCRAMRGDPRRQLWVKLG